MFESMQRAKTCERCWMRLERHNQALCDETWLALCENEERTRLSRSQLSILETEEASMGKKKHLVDIQTVRCPDCNSGMTYFLKRPQKYYCRNCRNKWDPPKEEQK